MNFNLTNLLGTIGALVAIAMSLATDILGCSTSAIGVTTCSASWLSPQLAGYAVLFFSGVALISKVIRPGGPLRGLFGSTAVIVGKDEAKVGVVTAAQVAAPGSSK